MPIPPCQDLLADLNSCRLWRCRLRVGANRFRAPTLDRLLTLILFRLGLMGRQEFHLFRGILRPGMTVLDVGANQGVFTLYCADRVGPPGKVIAFEPDPEMFSALEANVKANGKTWVELHNLAVSAQEGKVGFRISRLNRGDNRLVLTAQPAVETAPVRVVALDQLLGGRKVDVVKMDVQGWEGAVLRGMTGLLAAPNPCWILLEIWPDALRKAGSSYAEVIETLQRHGYSLCQADARRTALDPKKLSRLKGLLGYTNVLAVPPLTLQ